MLFRGVTGQGKAAGSERLNDQEVVVRLVKRTALGPGCAVIARRASGGSGIRFALAFASSAEVDERYVQNRSATPPPK